jgi:hypothetical protein
MTYLFVVLYALHGGSAMTSVDFSSKELCEQGRTAVLAMTDVKSETGVSNGYGWLYATECLQK